MRGAVSGTATGAVTAPPRGSPPVPQTAPVAAARRRTAGRGAAAAVALGAVLACPTGAAADPLTQFGTGMKYGLPLAAAVCAADQDRLGDFALRGILQAGIVWGMKQVFDARPIGRRPSGEGKGFPSGHSAAAFFGAADLAGKCFDDQPWAGAAAYGAAGLTGWSRIEAGEHTPRQVLGGALIGFGFGAASFGIGPEGAGLSVGLRF